MLELGLGKIEYTLAYVKRINKKIPLTVSTAGGGEKDGGDSDKLLEAVDGDTGYGDCGTVRTPQNGRTIVLNSVKETADAL